MSILLDIFNELSQPPQRDHYFLAVGGIRKSLAKAEAACEAQQSILKEIAARFGAERLTLANKTLLRWERMEDAAGFMLYFKKGAQPQGWDIPESWGDRQRFMGTYVHLPPQGSEDQKFLQDAARRMDEVMEAAYPTDGDQDRRAARREHAGWFHWGREVMGHYNLPGDDFCFAHATPVGQGTYTMSLTNRSKEIVLPPALSRCIPISKADADLLLTEPERAARIMQGKSARTLYERTLGRIVFG
jgi:hypothetical protein